MMNVKKIASRLNARYWAIGFVDNGLDGIMNDNLCLLKTLFLAGLQENYLKQSI